MFDFASSTSSAADARVDALVVIVDGDREDLLRAVLADDVLVEDRLDLGRLRDRGRAGVRLVLLDLLRDDVVAEPDALVADVDGRPGDELLHLLLRFAAEGAAQVAVLVIVPPSFHMLASCRRGRLPIDPASLRRIAVPMRLARTVRTSRKLSEGKLRPAPVQRRKLAARSRSDATAPARSRRALQRSGDDFSRLALLLAAGAPRR